MSTTIFDTAHRDELRAYTRKLLKVVEAKAGVDLGDFIMRYFTDDGDVIEEALCPNEQCKHYTFKGAIGIPCKNCKVEGSLYCAKHKKKIVPSVLEYVCLPEGEFLYDPLTFDMYMYDSREYVGKYLEGTLLYI
jgi:hypothetical protein